MKSKLLLVWSAALAMSWLPARAENWAGWRGPTGQGISGENHLRTTWDRTNGVRWRTVLPGPGNSTPIVWGRQVFVTQAMAKENRREPVSFARHDGKRAWAAGA